MPTNLSDIEINRNKLTSILNKYNQTTCNRSKYLIIYLGSGQKIYLFEFNEKFKISC